MVFALHTTRNSCCILWRYDWALKSTSDNKKVQQTSKATLVFEKAQKQLTPQLAQ